MPSRTKPEEISANRVLDSYGSCVDATTYVYATEIWPMHIRSKGSALATTGLFTSSLILQTVSPTAFDGIGWKYYMVFMSVSFAGAAAASVWWPEVRSLPPSAASRD